MNDFTHNSKPGSTDDPTNRDLPANGRISSAAALDAALDAAHQAALDKRIDAAIERKPAPALPADFAAVVSATLAARAAAAPRRSRAIPVGRTIGWVSAALLTAALFVVAPHATPNIASFRFDAEILLLVELAGIGWLLSRNFDAHRTR
ncbi:MAG TPA: hypothetical protein VHY48_09260 [Acidobacteriaceae bacterium]|jgi:hypothetical protein|nr:hypothetical protein [Acidobacteriaceae bacterium]